MARKSVREISTGLAGVWSSRISSANRYYDDWANRFRVEDLEQAYYGFQWDELDDPDHASFVLNMIFSSIDIKTPSLLFKEPVFTVSPKPSKSDFDYANATSRARLKEDALNYFVQSSIHNFAQEIELAILDAWFRFGVIEIGYSADWIQNPNSGKPILKSDRTPETDKDGSVVTEPEFLPEQEQLYVSRIPSKRFRVGGLDHANLNKCSWYGYLDFQRREDLIAAADRNPGYNKQLIVESGGDRSPDSIEFDINRHLTHTERQNFIKDQDIIPIWKIWDTRSNNLYIFDSSVSKLFYADSFERSPIKILKFRDMLEGFYPLPPTFNWISPQVDINETREAARVHRRQFMRKYLVQEDAISEEEMDKLQNGGDGTFVLVKRQGAIEPLPSAPLGSQHQTALQLSTLDFDRISATSDSQRGQSDRTTATESQLIEARTTIRESRDKGIVASWLNEIGKEILAVAKENISLPFWIRVSEDTPGLFAEPKAIEKKFQQIVSDDFGDEDFEVNIKVSSMSPVDLKEEKNKLIEFLTIVSQFPQITMSPTLVYAVADVVGFKNETAVAELARMAQLIQIGQLTQLSQQTGQDISQLGLEMFNRATMGGGIQGSAGSQGTQAQLTPPDMEQIRNQIQNQSNNIQ